MRLPRGAAAVVAASLLLAGCGSPFDPAASSPGGDRPDASSAAGDREGRLPVLAPPADVNGDPEKFVASFNELAATLPNARIGIAVAPVARQATPITAGEWAEGPAWSTSKVPIGMAAVRDGKISGNNSTLRASLEYSDNAASLSVWNRFGSNKAASDATERFIADNGGGEVEIKQGPYGLSTWSLSSQAAFMGQAACNTEVRPVYDVMGDITEDHSWGLGRIGDSHFKGGWGYTDGKYLTRQLGVFSTPRDGEVAVAIAAEPKNGSHETGTAALDAIADWLVENNETLPIGRC